MADLLATQGNLFEWSPRKDRGTSVHFVGIGGYGMSALAHVLCELGYRVTGSDLHPSPRTARLKERGVIITFEHSPANVEGAGMVVYSTDVPPANPELLAARGAKIPVYHRSELLASLMASRFSIAITGTHGKTTTTAMIAFLLASQGLDPTVLVGADFDPIGGTGCLGRGRYLVAEADESDRSFLRYRPLVAVITNVEPEHLEHYDGDFGRVEQAYHEFMRNVPPDGHLVLCTDDPTLRRIARSIEIPVTGYGWDDLTGLRAAGLQVDRKGTAFEVFQGSGSLGPVRLEIPGRHNVLNALAAIAVGLKLGMTFESLAATLRSYRGPRRRFEVCGQAAGITVIDDYAHHPTEIRETLAAARQRAAGRVIAVFQPQRYVRTHNLMREFSRAFSGADHLVLTPIYSPPGDTLIPGVSSWVLARLIEEYEGRSVVYLEDAVDVVNYLLRLAMPGDLIITMGAGDIGQVAHRLASELAGERTNPPPRPRADRPLIFSRYMC
ncbi:MAG TPA: UDP-N-acetylmuramate--L-alanine ligase [Bacillota bacterium]|nr:UDP-N-acetylmuramate--L-alanine ligase [Bacillota bacterium]